MSEETVCHCWNKAHLRLQGQVGLPRPANGNLHYELGQVYDSIRVQLRAVLSVPFLNQQDLRDFVAPRDEYSPQCSVRPASLLRKLQLPTHHHLICSPTLTSKVPRTLWVTLLIIKTHVNPALELLQPYVIQTAPSTAVMPETTTLIELITTLTKRMSDLNIKRKQQSQLEKLLSV